MSDELIKTQYYDGHDVDMTRRGFMDVKIKTEYANQTNEYMTTFISKSVSDTFNKNTFGEINDNNND